MNAFVAGLAAVGLTVAALAWLLKALASKPARPKRLSLDDEIRLLLTSPEAHEWRARL